MDNEIFEREKKYWDGMAAHDYETVRSLTKFPCIVGGEARSYERGCTCL